MAYESPLLGSIAEEYMMKNVGLTWFNPTATNLLSRDGLYHPFEAKTSTMVLPTRHATGFRDPK